MNTNVDGAMTRLSRRRSHTRLGVRPSSLLLTRISTPVGIENLCKEQRPRAQHRTNVGWLATNGTRADVGELLRPRTGALLSVCGFAALRSSRLCGTLGCGISLPLLIRYK